MFVDLKTGVVLLPTQIFFRGYSLSKHTMFLGARAMDGQTWYVVDLKTGIVLLLKEILLFIA